MLPIESIIAQQFAQITMQLRRDGTPIATNDIWIAATAKARRLVLVSNDAAFRFVADLRLENWAVA